MRAAKPTEASRARSAHAITRPSELTRLKDTVRQLEITSHEQLELERESQYVFDFLRNENQRLKKAVAVLSTVVDREVRRLQADQETIRSDFKGNQEVLRAQLKGDTDTLRAEIRGELRTEARGEADNLRVEVEALRQELGALRGDVNAARNELALVRNECDKRRCEYEELRSDHVRRPEYEDLRSEMNTLRSNNDQVRTHWESMRHEWNSMRELRVEWKSQSDLRAEWNALSRNQNELRDEHKTLHHEYGELRQQNGALYHEYMALRKEHDEFRHVAQSQHDIIRSLQEEAHRETSSQQQQTQALRTEVTTLNSTLGDRISSIHSSLDEKITQVGASLGTKLSEKLEESRTELNEVRRRHTVVRSQTESLARALAETRHKQQQDTDSMQHTVNEVQESISKVGSELRDQGKTNSAAIARVLSSAEAETLKLKQQLEWVTERLTENQIHSHPRLELRSPSRSPSRLGPQPQQASLNPTVSTVVTDSVQRRVDDLSSRHGEAAAHLGETSAEVLRHRDAIMLLVETVDTLSRDTKTFRENIIQQVTEVSEESEKGVHVNERALAGLKGEVAALHETSTRLEKFVMAQVNTVQDLQHSASQHSEWAAAVAREQDELRKESARIAATLRSLKTASREAMNAISDQKSRLRVAIDEMGLRRVHDANAVLRYHAGGKVTSPTAVQ